MKIIISEAQMNYLVKNIELNDSENQLHQFKKELLFQYKIHELRLNMFEYDSEKENYLNSIKRTYTPYFKKNNTIPTKYNQYVRLLHTRVYIPSIKKGNKIKITRSCVKEFLNVLNPSELLFLLYAE